MFTAGSALLYLYLSPTGQALQTSPVITVRQDVYSFLESILLCWVSWMFTLYSLPTGETIGPQRPFHCGPTLSNEISVVHGKALQAHVQVLGFSQ